MCRRVAPHLLTLLAGIVLVSAATARAAEPYYEDAGACPFECCTYREWTTGEPTTVHQRRDVKSPIAFRLERGEPVTAVTGVVVTLRPGKAVVLRPLKLGTDDKSVDAKPGDVLSLLHYQGEGYFKFKLRGDILVDEVPFPKKHEGRFGMLGEDHRTVTASIRTESVPTTVWWVQLRDRRGDVGWSNQPSHFDHVDACE